MKFKAGDMVKHEKFPYIGIVVDTWEDDNLPGYFFEVYLLMHTFSVMIGTIVSRYSKRYELLVRA